MATSDIRAAPDGWTKQDQAILVSCQIIGDICRGRVPPMRAQTMFALPPDAVAFVSGPARIFELRAAGDGSYTTNGSFVFGTGRLGMAMMAGSLIGNAVANSRARSQAMADAQVAFRFQFEAGMYVANTGFIFHGAEGVFTWLYGDVHAMQLIEPNTVLMQGASGRGTVTWKMVSPYAELILVLWALERHPQHPQLCDGSWLADGWLEYARAQGYDPGLTSPVLATAEQIMLPGQHDHERRGL